MKVNIMQKKNKKNTYTLVYQKQFVQYMLY